MLILTLAACSEEAGPTPEQQQPEDPGPEALHVKLDALTADECFRLRDEMQPPDCEKYITQVANVPDRARDYAGTEHPDLREAADDLDSGIADYRNHKCDREENADASACSAAIDDVADAVAAVKAEVEQLPEMGEASR